MPVTKSIGFQTRDGLTLRGQLTLMDKPNAPLLIMVSPVWLHLEQLQRLALLTYK